MDRTSPTCTVARHRRGQDSERLEAGRPSDSSSRRSSSWWLISRPPGRLALLSRRQYWGGPTRWSS